MTTNDKPFFSEEDYALLRREKCRELTDDQFAVFRHAIERYRLDPFANQIYAVVRNINVGKTDQPRWEKRMTVQTGIDGFRLVADRTEVYAGNDDPVYDDERKPTKATVTVYKIVGAQRCPFAASARWDQYYPGDRQGQMWKRMPHLMLGKCAEALALRKAFPAELSGLYTGEEMAQADRGADASPTSNGNGKSPAPDAPPARKPGKEAALYATARRTMDESEGIRALNVIYCSLPATFDPHPVPPDLLTHGRELMSDRCCASAKHFAAEGDEANLTKLEAFARAFDFTSQPLEELLRYIAAERDAQKAPAAAS